MKFIEKASGWLIVTGLAIAVLLAFNYLDVFIMFGFRSAGLSTKIYRGAYSITAALANTVLALNGFHAPDWRAALADFVADEFRR